MLWLILAVIFAVGTYEIRDVSGYQVFAAISLLFLVMGCGRLLLFGIDLLIGKKTEELSYIKGYGTRYYAFTKGASGKNSYSYWYFEDREGKMKKLFFPSEKDVNEFDGHPPKGFWVSVSYGRLSKIICGWKRIDQ